MPDILSLVIEKFLELVELQIPMMIGLACLFSALALWKSQTANPGKVWWRNPGLGTDITYSLVHGVIGPYFNRPAIIFVYALLASMVMSSTALVR